VLAALLTRFLRGRGVSAAALKPVCSGSRGDARLLHAAMGGALALAEINPWHFRAPVAPLLAARRENRRVNLPAACAHIRALQKRFEIVLVEGAGGLLSPLGDDFNSRALITALHARPVVVAQNKLGVVNHLLLTLEALPPAAAKTARVVLMSPPKPDAASETNLALLSECFDPERIFALPWLGKNFSADEALKNPRVKRALQGLLA